jgi:hypothetical protein
LKTTKRIVYNTSTKLKQIQYIKADTRPNWNMDLDAAEYEEMRNWGTFKQEI